MAGENLGKTISLKAATSAVGKKFAPVKVSAENTFAFCDAGEACVGFIQDEVIAAEYGRVAIQGITFAKAAAVIAAGAKVACGANNTVITAANGAAIIGIALDPATAAGDIISVLINVNGNAAAAAPGTCVVTATKTPAEGMTLSIFNAAGVAQVAEVDGTFKLIAGLYYYSASAASYTAKSDIFMVSAADVTTGTKTIVVTLTAA